MDTTRIASVFFIIIALVGLYLVQRNALLPTVQAAITQTDSTYNVDLGAFALALGAYLFVLSLLSPRNGGILTGIIVLGALLNNNQRLGNADLINTLLNPKASAPNTVNGPIGPAGPTGQNIDPNLEAEIAAIAANHGGSF